MAKPFIQVPNQVAINVAHHFSNTPTPQGLASGVNLTANRGNVVEMNVFGGMRARTLIASQLLSGRDMEENLEAADVCKALRLADMILAQDNREAVFRKRLWECRSPAELEAVAEKIRGEMEPHELPSLEQWILDFLDMKPEFKGQAA